MDTVRRSLYLDRLAEISDPGLVKIVTGVRRCGKSTLMQQVRDNLIASGEPPASIVSIDFELTSARALLNPSEFEHHIREVAAENVCTHLFIDEVQEFSDWPLVVNGLRAELGLDVYVTGSNARMFSGESMTYLSGRYVTLEMLPLSLPELCQFKGIDNPEDAYESLVSDGGFPAVALAPTDSLKTALLDGIYESVFTRDILLRGGIRNEAAFLRVAAFVLDNVGSQTSASSISRSLAAGGHKVSAETVDNYLSLMQSAHLIYRCERYDIRGKERLRTNGKYYAVDPGLRNRVLGTDGSNRGHVTENVVYLELLRRGLDVFVGSLPNAEIDFVAQAGKQRWYVQVSETVLDPTTLERETRHFNKLHDGWPRVLITKDRADFSSDGIIHMNLYDFLMGRPLP